jgi:aldehyde dehydrogenase (NAD+)
VKIENAAELEGLFHAQGKARWAVAATGPRERVLKLKALREAIIARQEELYAALWQDFHKSSFEAWMTEVFPSIEEIDVAIRNLSSWMRDRRVTGLIFLPGSKSYLRHEPKGRVLIMSPWNYPFQLLMGPLVSAIAAGNTVIAKPSNKTPRTSAFIAALLADLFPQDEVAVVEGSGALLGDLLLKLPFDHIFFTGSPKIGARVGEAAQRIHSGLTLELGGKSPAVILDDADLDLAACKVAWGKCLNAGQTCVAPDYVLCPRDKVDAFADLAAAEIKRMYGDNEAQRRAAPDFPRIVDAEACARHEALTQEAIQKGARLALGGAFDVSERYAPATILAGVTPHMAIMEEEIFGPIMPILPYDSVDEAIAFIHARPKPLALYVFGKSRLGTGEILDRTTSGSACVNDVIVQIENLNVPFGGVGMSGTGNYHGIYGFRAFSHERNYMRKGKLNAIRLFYPPYARPITNFMKGALEAILGMKRK